MDQNKWRQPILNKLDEQWDIIVVGGGITGAGIFREASRLGLKVFLVEQRDYAWGTSSRSSKLVHGGLRYLKDGNILLTRAAVLERERLLEDGPGLIDPLGFLLTIYKGDAPGRWTYEAGLSIYDLLALQWGHRYYDADEMNMLAPHIALDNLEGGFQYGDAQTDDARLVFRLVQEAIADGGYGINYCKVVDLLINSGQVCGVVLLDGESGSSYKAYSKVVINATGIWVDKLRSLVTESSAIRPLRGSHLLFPAWRLPVAQAICFLHPFDRRPVFIFPWENATIVGTTDVDHNQPLDEEASITPNEVTYLMAAVNAQFPSLNIQLEDILSTFAGVRPVIGTGKGDPSQETRDHVVWEDQGLITVTGGKLTTFRLLALEVLKKTQLHLSEFPQIRSDFPVLNTVNLDDPGLYGIPASSLRRLLGRFGNLASRVIAIAHPGELFAIPGADSLWVELRWSARSEQVCHLEDMLLRRLRIGLLLPDGGKAFLPRIREICQSELNWCDEKWEEEENNYLNLWKTRYYLPDINDIPDWKSRIAEVRIRRGKILQTTRRQMRNACYSISGAIFVMILFGYFLWRKQRKTGS